MSLLLIYIITVSTAVVPCEICCEGGKQTEEVRKKFLDLHNEFRSRLARGLEKNVKLYNKTSLSASAMMKMKYDCTAERLAQKAADKCRNEHTRCAELEGYNENRARVMGTKLDPLFAAERALTAWWKEFAKHGSHWNNIYTKEMLAEGKMQHYVQMAWSRTTHVGCAVKNCRISSMVFCRYKPGGRRLNEVIYEVGDTCSACPNGTTCEKDTGLCA
ncbi:unnamed protein product [Cylicocyclus nassatus]|uniref:SCP domain-containing protein n=1 Tax=Cylicocyclus nassatus TaxID=53992 RepID=A0AA36GFY1_CYLNA|nr:unnamed protein product [Cylicocyclus nassatus]